MVATTVRAFVRTVPPRSGPRFAATIPISASPPNTRAIETALRKGNYRLALLLAKYHGNRQVQEDVSLRTRILRASQGRLDPLTSAEAYTTQDFSLRDFSFRSANIWEILNQPDAWLPEVAAQHREMTDDFLRAARRVSSYLSRHFSHPTSVYVWGPVGGGKSRWLRECELMRDIPDLPNGVLAPDWFKRLLRLIRLGITHSTVHLESAHLVFWARMAIFREWLHVVEDSISEMRKVEMALQANRHAMVYDMAAPHEHSANVLIGRDPNGMDPCIPFNEFVSCHIRANEERLKLIENITRSGIHYELIVYDPRQDKRIMAADWNGHRFHIRYPELFKTAVHENQEAYAQTLQAFGQIRISAEFIEAQCRASSPAYAKLNAENWKRYEGHWVASAMDAKCV